MQRQRLYTCWGTLVAEIFGQARAKRPIESVVLKEGQAEPSQSTLTPPSGLSRKSGTRSAACRIDEVIYCTDPAGRRQDELLPGVSCALDLDVCLLSLSDEGLTDDRLAFRRWRTPRETAAYY